MTDHFSQNLRTIILNCKEPFVIRDTLNWDMLEWSLAEWSKLLNQEEMEFRSGKYEYTLVGLLPVSYLVLHVYCRSPNGRDILKYLNVDLVNLPTQI